MELTGVQLKPETYIGWSIALVVSNALEQVFESKFVFKANDLD